MRVDLFVDVDARYPSAHAFAGTCIEQPGFPTLTFSFSTLQFSSGSKPPDSNQQLQQALEERARLETRVGQVRPCRARGVEAG